MSKLSKIAALIERWITSVSRGLNAVGITMLVLIMLIMVADVILRNTTAQAVLGSVTFELVMLMFCLVVFFGMANTDVNKRHISVDVLTSRFSQEVQKFIEIFVYFFSIVVLSLSIWRTAVYADSLRQAGDSTVILHIPYYPFAYMVSLGIACLCLVLLVDFSHSVIAVIKSRWRLKQGLIATSVVLVLLLVSTMPLWLQYLSSSSLEPVMLGYLGIALLFILLFLRMYIGLAMAFAGFLGVLYLAGTNPAFGLLGSVPFNTPKYDLIVIPLFVLMGEFAFAGGLTRDLYSVANKWLTRLPGGLAITTIAACAGFASVCGSSAATAAAVGKVALPEMQKYKYDGRLATGSIAAGGTLGILIPPSVAFALYGVLSETSIGKLFIAGILPGVLLAFLFMLTVYIQCRHNTKLGPPGPSTTFVEKIVALKDSWPIIFLFLLVVVGLYTGFFTATEIGAIGSFAALLIALCKRQLRKQSFIDAISETGTITAMIFLIIVGANIYNFFLALTGLPTILAEFVAALSVPPLVILLGILFVYLLLGCVTEIYTMIILTLPIFLPILNALGFDLVFFGVLMVIMIEMGLITPPIGVNVFIIKGIATDVTMGDIFRGVFPFLAAMIICIGLLIAFPQIALFLPNLMKGG